VNWLRPAACALVWALTFGPCHATGLDPAFEAQAPSAAAHQVARWIAARHDNRALPFAIVDKADARLFVFSAEGRLAGATPALLGQAMGDVSVPGIGERPLSQVKPHERTTPAGRFASEPGRNLSGEAVVWVDYDAAVAIHRVRPGRSEAARRRALASSTRADNRLSMGCVVVPEAFFVSVVQPTLGQSAGVVYVLPDTLPLQALFPLDAAVLAQR
jgi:hypothetical protein